MNVPGNSSIDRQAALLECLKLDLKAHLDPYQFDLSVTGKPIWPDADAHQYASHALVSKIFSKLTHDGKPSATASEAALAKFLRCNEICRDFNLSPQDYRDEELLGDISLSLWKFFNPDGFPLFSSFEEIVSRGGVGPGASVSARGDDLYTKVFDSSLSYTRSDLLDSWEFTVVQNANWFEALVSLYQRDIPVAVRGSKLSFVSKNDKVARTICTEPTINMWFQLGLGRLLQDRLKQFWNIDLATQPDVNREMAYAASCGADLCTIDLESASDSISIGLLKAILPQEAFNWLLKTRSEETQLPNGEYVHLNMISTMGNGFTFPLQTVIFAAIVTSVYRHLGIPLIKRGVPKHRNFAVFGDDILCCKRAYSTVVRLLHLCGFKVNASKSFSEGSFYESCGRDYYNGHNVRPFYAKRLRTDQDLFRVINGLTRWSAIQGIPLRATCQALLAWVRRPRWVPPYESDDAGIHVPKDMGRGKHIGHGIIRYLLDVPRKRYLLIKEDVISCGRDQRRRRYNPSGLWLSFLYGSVRGYRISLRQREVLYTTKPKATVHWDSLGPLCQSLGIGWPRWSSAASWNISPP